MEKIGYLLDQRLMPVNMAEENPEKAKQSKKNVHGRSFLIAQDPRRQMVQSVRL